MPFGISVVENEILAMTALRCSFSVPKKKGFVIILRFKSPVNITLMAFEAAKSDA